MIRRLDDLVAALDAPRLVAGLGALALLLVLAGWVVGAVKGSALTGQVAAAVAAFLISAATLMYAFRLRTSPASE